ncbi:hypothetical protein [Streptomyces sp. NPDC056544]|uniref:hypothetical protein n=1 Tax=unclassified Streptomyces TaxID=2593676 RepID=UPI0036A4C1DF
MAVDALPGIRCTCLGDVRLELFDRDGRRDWLAAMPAGPEGTVVVVGIPGRRPRARAGPVSRGGLTTKIHLAAIFICRRGDPKGTDGLVVDA